MVVSSSNTLPVRLFMCHGTGRNMNTTSDHEHPAAAEEVADEMRDGTDLWDELSGV